jgi:hypothetical protein
MPNAHVQWLALLSPADRIQYDRAFGAAWFKGRSETDCRAAGIAAVKGTPCPKAK